MSASTSGTSGVMVPMLILNILDHDLHRSRDPNAVPQAVEVAVHPDNFPCVVIGSKGEFLYSRGPQKNSGMTLCPVFKHDSDRMDSLIGPLLDAAFLLSDGQTYKQFRRPKSRKKGATKGSMFDVAGTYKNAFRGPGAAGSAFEYVQRTSGLKIQPHVCLIPEAWYRGPKDTDVLKKFLGEGYDPVKRRFRECCKVIGHDVSMPVFLSRPDMVGMYTQFMAGGSSVILHNVELGIAFCPQG